MVLNVENVFKLQADHETFLQSDRIEAFGALRIRVGEVRAGDHASPLGEEVVTALHYGKHIRAKSPTTHGHRNAFLICYCMVQQWSLEALVGKEYLSPITYGETEFQ